MEQYADQGERDIKKMEAKVESLAKNANVTEWSAQKERRVRRVAQSKGECDAQYTGTCLPSPSHIGFLLNNWLAT